MSQQYQWKHGCEPYQEKNSLTGAATVNKRGWDLVNVVMDELVITVLLCDDYSEWHQHGITISEQKQQFEPKHRQKR